MTIPKTQRNKIKRMFIIEGKKMFEISQITGVRLRTIAHWSTKEDWRARRSEYNESQNKVELNLFKLYEALTEKASKTLAAEDIKVALQLGKTLEKKKG